MERAPTEKMYKSHVDDVQHSTTDCEGPQRHKLQKKTGKVNIATIITVCHYEKRKD